jgi:hypothetical protein
MRFLESPGRSRKLSRPVRHRPWLEILEDRTVPSIVVTNGNLEVTCDTATELKGGNAITLDAATNGQISVQIKDSLGNVESQVVDPSTVTEILLDGCAAGNDSFDISYTPATAHTSSERAWQGSDGGLALLESEPAYQTKVQSTGYRTSPDIAYDADPNNGFLVYSSVPQGGDTDWFSVGGTSAGAPQVAALVAIANQGRALAGKGTLDGAQQTLPAPYSVAGTAAYASVFNDVSVGGNGYSARPDYDLATGLGTPEANQMINFLAGLATTSAAGTTVPAAATPVAQPVSKSTTSTPATPATISTTDTDVTLAIQEEVLGPKHPDTAAGYHNLAANLHAQGKARDVDPPNQARALAIALTAVKTPPVLILPPAASAVPEGAVPQGFNFGTRSTALSVLNSGQVESGGGGNSLVLDGQDEVLLQPPELIPAPRPAEQPEPAKAAPAVPEVRDMSAQSTRASWRQYSATYFADEAWRGSVTRPNELTATDAVPERDLVGDLAALLVGACAVLGLPRIDTGDRRTSPEV